VFYNQILDPIDRRRSPLAVVFTLFAYENKGAHRLGDVKILFVCLGNICRSPTAEGVLRHLAGTEAPDLALKIDSAGTAGYHIGAAPDPRSQRAALRRGVDISELRARQVTIEDFAHFDFILAMDRENLKALEAMQPKNSRARLALFLDFAPGLNLSEVPDPYYGDTKDFEKVLDLTIAASRGLLARLQEGA
jgi:protein-tyrosine phosphatase